ncbi:MAG: hypothetical protein C4519_08145, partial [Desulfobacteraceae bacterium]
MKKHTHFGIVFTLIFAVALAGCGGGSNGVGTTTYTTTYAGNGNDDGSVPVDSTGYEPSQTVTVPGNTGNLVRSGYAFTGWNTQADGSGTTYTQGQTFTMETADITLYARWTANPTYTVIYAGNGEDGGSVPVDTTNYEEGQIVTVLGNTGNLVRAGYAFAGWNTQADGSGTTYTQDQNFTVGAVDVTLYVRWTANPTYTITYDGNGEDGGSVPVDTTNYEEGQIVTVLGNTGNLARDGYAFAGWNTQADGSGTTYTQDQNFTVGAVDVVLYAKWTYGGGTGVAGDLDTSFDDAGVVTTLSDGMAYAVAIQGDGKILVAGDGASVVRYNDDGTLDSEFGT